MARACPAHPTSATRPIEVALLARRAEAHRASRAQTLSICLRTGRHLKRKYPSDSVEFRVRVQQCNALVQSDTRDEAVRGASNRDAAFAQGASDLGAVYEGRFAHRQQRERLEPCAGSLQCGVSLRIPCSTSVGTIPHSARSWYDRTRDSRRRVCEASRPAKKSIQTLVSTRVIPFPFRALRPAFRPKRSNPSGPSVCAGSCAGADHAARNR